MLIRRRFPVNLITILLVDLLAFFLIPVIQTVYVKVVYILCRIIQPRSLIIVFEMGGSGIQQRIVQIDDQFDFPQRLSPQPRYSKMWKVPRQALMLCWLWV